MSTAGGGKGRWRKSLRTASAMSTAGDLAGTDTCSSDFSLLPMSKVANSCQAARPRNWVMLLTKIAWARSSMSRGAGASYSRTQPEIVLSRDENLHNKQEIGTPLWKQKKNFKKID